MRLRSILRWGLVLVASATSSFGQAPDCRLVERIGRRPPRRPRPSFHSGRKAFPGCSCHCGAGGRSGRQGEQRPHAVAHGVPGSRGRDKNGTAVIVCPGGAYRRLAIDKEGTDVAVLAQLARRFGVRLEVPDAGVRSSGAAARRAPRGPAPAVSGVALERCARSDRRHGILGRRPSGGVGGHAVRFAPEGRTGAALDRVSARPDFLVLVYPVISMNPHLTRMRDPRRACSVPHRLAVAPRQRVDEPAGDAADATGLPRPRRHRHGRAAREQRAVLQRASTRGRAHRTPRLPGGRHGFGLEPNHGPISTWPTRCAEWLAVRGLLARAAGPAASARASPA